MTTRERKLVGTIIAVMLGAGVVLFAAKRWFLDPLDDYSQKISSLEDEVGAKRNQVLTIQRDRPLLERSRLLSLPGDANRGATEYAKYLKPLLEANGLKVEE